MYIVVLYCMSLNIYILYMHHIHIHTYQYKFKNIYHVYNVWVNESDVTSDAFLQNPTLISGKPRLGLKI